MATLEARAENFNLTLQRATGRLDKIAGDTEKANTRIARSHAAIEGFAAKAARGVTLLGTALAGAAGALAFFATRQFQALDKLGDLSKQTGLTADQLRKLQVGLELNGGSAEQAGEGILTFARNLAQAEAGTGRMAGLLKKLDPAFLETLRSSGNTGDALRLVADRIAVARSEQEKLAIATAAFGPAGRQFVLLLGEGQAGLDKLNAELERVGVGFDERLVASVQRADDAFRLLKGTLTDQLTKGLFDTGEGVNRIADALNPGTIENLGEFANAVGRLASYLVSVGADVLGSWGEFFELVGREELSFSDALFAAGQPLDVLNERLAESSARVAELDALLSELGDTGGALPEPAGFFDLEARNRRAEIEALRADRAEAERQRVLLQGLAQERQPFVGPPRPPRQGLGLDLGLEGPGARAAETETAVQKAHARILQLHETFVAAMRTSSAGALTEAQQLSLKLAETLGKIGEAAQQGTISATEASEFQRAAIEEATAAITAAEQEALAKQQDQIGDFLDQFGGTAVSQADRVAQQIREALDKIPDLTPEQRTDLERQAAPTIDRARQQEQGGVEIELLQRSARIQSASLFGLSHDLERALAEAEAKVEASELDQKIAEAFGGDSAEAKRLIAENHELLEQELADIRSNWDETFSKIGDLGEQVFGDFLEGIAQGSEATAEDMVRAFALGFLKIEAAALATDLRNILGGDGGEPTSITGQVLSSLGGGDAGGQAAAEAEKSIASGLEAGASRAGDILVGAFDRGVGLLEVGGSALTQALSAGGQLVLAAIEAGAAALAAASAATTSFLGLAEGGVVVGEAGSERIFGLSDVPEILARSGGQPYRAAQLAMQMGERVATPQLRDLGPGTLVVPDRKLAPFFARMMPRAHLAEGGGILPLDRLGFAGQNTGSDEGGIEVNLNLTNQGQPLQVKNVRTQRRGAKVDIFAELSAADTNRGGPGVKAMQSRFGLEPQVREPG